MRHIEIDADGHIVRILNDEAEGLLPREVPDEYPETVAWDPATLEFVPAIDKLQARLWDRVKARREAAYMLAPTPFGTADADPESRVFINGCTTMALIALTAGSAFAQDFKLADNTIITLDATQMLQFGVAVAMHIDRVFKRGETLRTLIFDPAVDESSLSQLTAEIEEGWDAGTL